MVDHDEVALAPAVMLSVVGRGTEETVPVALDHIEPRLARVAVQRLGLAGGELDHHLGDAGSFAADGAVHEELRARAARRGEQVLLVVRRVYSPATSLFYLTGYPA